MIRTKQVKETAAGRESQNAGQGLADGKEVVEKTIAEPDEKRADTRYECGSPLEWTYFNRQDPHSARMVNFSISGACFESSKAVTAGANVMLRVATFKPECRAECSEGVGCPWPRSFTIGEVRWCRDVSGTSRPRFGVGVKFHVPV
jgi:hypothetical protein